jgi:hypothetical protein
MRSAKVPIQAGSPGGGHLHSCSAIYTSEFETTRLYSVRQNIIGFIRRKNVLT